MQMKAESEKVEFEGGFAVGYTFAVPECFREALEKDKFAEGDVFYDHRKAYEVAWGEALSHISVSLQVRDNLAGMVRFSILRPNSGRTGLVVAEERRVTAEEFGEILRMGLK